MLFLIKSCVFFWRQAIIFRWVCYYYFVSFSGVLVFLTSDWHTCSFVANEVDVKKAEGSGPECCLFGVSIHCLTTFEVIDNYTHSLWSDDQLIILFCRTADNKYMSLPFLGIYTIFQGSVARISLLDFFPTLRPSMDFVTFSLRRTSIAQCLCSLVLKDIWRANF